MFLEPLGDKTEVRKILSGECETDKPEQQQLMVAAPSLPQQTGSDMKTGSAPAASSDLRAGFSHTITGTLLKTAGSEQVNRSDGTEHVLSVQSSAHAASAAVQNNGSDDHVDTSPELQTGAEENSLESSNGLHLLNQVF